MRNSLLWSPGRAVALCSLAALFLGACSVGGGGSTPTGPITFAVATALTGPFAYAGLPFLEGVRAAQTEITAAGGILGRPLQIDSVDTLGDVGDAVPALNKELAIGQPKAIIGGFNSDVFGMQPIIDRAQIPLGWQGGSPQFDTNADKWLWRCVASDTQLGVAMAVEAWDKGYKNAAILVSADAATEALIPVITKAFQTLGGQIVGSIVVTPLQTSYLSEVQRVINMHPDVIFTQFDPGDAGVVFPEFQQLNSLSIPFIGTDLTAGPDFIKAVKPAVAKAHLISVQGSNALTNSGPNFAQFYQQANGHAPLSGSANAYDCAIVFALAMTKAGTDDPRIWVNSITQVSNPPGVLVADYKTAVADIKAGTKINYEGASGPMDFNQYHNVSGAWDVVQATGDAADATTTVATISADAVQAVVQQEK